MNVVGLVPAYDSEQSVGACVSALLRFVDEVLVIDDGSSDRTAEEARDVGAAVLQLGSNSGKGAAVAAGVRARPAADFYLLADADLGATAAGLSVLLGPVVSGAADMTIGVLPSAGTRGGFGLARDFAGWGIARATGWRPDAPISGQRAIRGPLLRALMASAPDPVRFGLEPALSIDAVRNGARVLELPVAVDHHHRGRSVRGFVHRGRQASDIARALWPRLTSTRARIAIMVAAFLAAVVVSHAVAGAREPQSKVLLTGSRPPSRVLLVGMPGLRIDDMRLMPNLSALAARGATGALTVRTLTGYPTSVEGYATVGAGTRVDAGPAAAQAFNRSEPLEAGSAGEVLTRRTGYAPSGEVVVVGAAAAPAESRRPEFAPPGSLGDALHRAGLSTAVIGNADRDRRAPQLSRPAAIALMDHRGSVDLGRVDRGLLTSDPKAPFGLLADSEKVVVAVRRAVAQGADVLIVDPGDLDRAMAFADAVSAVDAERQRVEALRRLDALLPELVLEAGHDAMVIALGVTPPAPDWHLTPLVVHGRSVEPGSLLHSALTRRPGVASITDIAPTILGILEVERPRGMVGSLLRTAADTGGSAASHIDRLERVDRIAAYRERIYVPSTVGYVVFQALVYLLALIVFRRTGQSARLGGALRWAALVVAAYPLATFLHRSIPGVESWGAVGVALLPLLAAAAAGLAVRLGRRKPLAPLGWVAGLTVGLLAVDVSMGAPLQSSSLLGYSFHAPGRFTGFGNQAFAILVATTILAAAIHVHHSPRRTEALTAVALLFFFVAILDGSPALGSDVGGILTMGPVFALTWWAMARRRLSWRPLAAAVGVTLLALGVAAAIDVARPAESRTHLGRLASDVARHGAEPLFDTVARKVSTNLQSWGTPWAWVLAVLAVTALVILLAHRNWERVLPGPGALRAGFGGTVAAGLLGYAVNDSGVVIAALTFVFVGPFLMLHALDRSEPPIELAPMPGPVRPLALAP